MYAYKIKNSEGLYSTGGYCPQFVKQGKLWKSRRAVMLHLALFANFREQYRGCSIEEYSLVLIHEGPMETWDAPIEAEERRRQEQERQVAAHQKWMEERDLKEYNQMKIKLEMSGLI